VGFLYISFIRRISIHPSAHCIYTIVWVFIQYNTLIAGYSHIYLMRLSPSKVHNTTKFLFSGHYYRHFSGCAARPVTIRGFRPVLVSIPALTSFTLPSIAARTITTQTQSAELEMSSESSSSPEKAEKNQQQQTDGDDDDKKELPKLTPAEFRVYNRMAEHMDYFVSLILLRFPFFCFNFFCYLLALFCL
jgi:hypothetical protein